MTTFFLLSDRFWCPVAYPIALPDPACLGVAVRFSCDSSRWVGYAKGQVHLLPL